MKARLRKHWFLVGIAVVWVLGFALPEWSRAYQGSRLVDWAIALVMFCGALNLETAHLFEQVRNWRAVGLSFVMMYAVAPVLVFAASWPLRMGDSATAEELFVGFMILAAQSCTLGSGIVISTAARGNVALALVVTVLNSMAAAVMTPLILALTLSVRVEFGVLHMIGRLALIILLPVALGQLVRPFLRTALVRLSWLPSLLSQLVILSLIFMAVGSASAWMKERPLLVVALLAGTLALHVAILAVNYGLSVLATPDIPSRRSLAICSSQKTLATGSYVWARYFADNPLGTVPLMFYHVVQLVFDSLLAHWLAQRDSRPSPSTLDTLGEAEEQQV